MTDTVSPVGSRLKSDGILCNAPDDVHRIHPAAGQFSRLTKSGGMEIIAETCCHAKQVSEQDGAFGLDNFAFFCLNVHLPKLRDISVKRLVQENLSPL